MKTWSSQWSPSFQSKDKLTHQLLWPYKIGESWTFSPQKREGPAFETGIVQKRVKELRDRIECHRKELQNLYSPQNLFQQVLPWLLPFLGPLVLIILFLLFIYSSYLDPVSSISFKGFSKNGFGPSLKITSRPFFFSRASPQAQKKETLGPRMILHSRPKIIAPIQQEVAREIRCPFSHFFFNDFRVWNEGVFWAQKRKQQSQRPLLNHLTSEKTKQNFRSHPDAPGRLHLSGTYHPLSRNLPPSTPAQKTYHPLPNYKWRLN